MNTIDDAAEVIGRYTHPDFAEDAAHALAAEGHLTPADAPDLAQTIAGMREEWAVEMYHDVDDTWRQYTTWVATGEGASQHLAVDGYRWGQNYRLVRRLVGPVEAIDE